MSTSFLPFDPTAHKIVSLLALFGKKGVEAETVTTKEFEDQLKTRGWCIVDLKDQVAEVAKLVAEVNNFFALPQEQKDKCHIKPQFGYSKVDHKEGIRFLSERFPTLAPRQLETEANVICRDMDNLSMRIAQKLAKMLKISPAALALRADLPVAYVRQVGMFDIAYYFNERAGQAPPPEGESVDDVNCVPHYDPGLVSISFFSNQEGLQLLDPSTNQWYAGPINTVDGQEKYGVLWLGEAAAKLTEGNWKAGVHRVIYPALQGPRLTMWYEACTVAQINGPDDSKPVEEGPALVPNIKGPGKMMMMAPQSRTDALLHIERRRGLPMSKVARIDDNFKSMENIPGFPPPAF